MSRKQDELSVLEQQLEEIDRAESKLLYLGSLRRDQNPECKRIIDEIGIALRDYGESHIVDSCTVAISGMIKSTKQV